MQIKAHNSALHSLTHVIANTGNGFVRMEVCAPETQSRDEHDNLSSSNRRTDITFELHGNAAHGDITLGQAQVHGLIDNPNSKVSQYYGSFKPHMLKRHACSATALRPLAEALHNKSNRMAVDKQKKYRNVPLTNNSQNNTVRSFHPIVATTNGVLHQSSLDFIEHIVQMDEQNLCPDRELYIRGYLRNAILSHTAHNHFLPIPMRSIRQRNVTLLPLKVE